MTNDQLKLAVWANKNVSFAYGFSNKNQNEAFETLRKIKLKSSPIIHRIGQIDDHPQYGDILYVVSLMKSTDGIVIEADGSQRKTTAEEINKKPFFMFICYFKEFPMTQEEAHGNALAIFTTSFHDFPIET